MKKKLGTARTISTAIRGSPGKLHRKRAGGRRFARLYTVNAAGKRGLHNPPAQ
jgi:hypothetical protein